MPNEKILTPHINVYATIAYWVLLATLLTVPLVILPIFDNFVTASKTLMLLVSATSVFGIFALRAAQKGRLQLPVSPLVASLFTFGVFVLVSSLLSTKYPVTNLLGMGGVYLSVVMIAILGGALLPKKRVSGFIHALSLSGALVSITSLLQVAGFGPSRIINSLLPLQLPNDLTFNLTGSPFVAAQFLAIAILGGAVYMFSTKKASKLLIAGVIVNLIGFALNAWVSLPGQIATPLLLPFTAAWPIALDTLRTPRPALIGVGPENYGIAYSIFKPAWTNVTDWWNIQFVQGTNAPLTLLTSTGLLGVGSWLLVVWTVFKQMKINKKDSGVFTALVIALSIFVIQLLFAPNIVLLSVLTIALAFAIAESRKKFLNIQAFAMHMASTDMTSGETTQQPRFAKYFAGLIGIVLTGSLFYLVGRSYFASNTIFRSLLAVQANDAVQVYELQQQATQLNPYVDSYRRRYAQTNMQIAAALSNKADLTEEEQNQVAQLIQQAIREARAATILGENDSQNWTVLAQIYRNLIGTAEDAPDWAVSAYVKAIETAPSDPNLRIELGGIFFNQQNFSQALSLFQQAADLKADLPNAYYNAANTLKLVGEYEQAKAAYQRTLLLLEPDSEGYIQASKELAEVEEMIAKSADDKEKTTGDQGQLNSILNQNVNQLEPDVINAQSQPLDQTTQQNLEGEQQGEFAPEQQPAQ